MGWQRWVGQVIGWGRPFLAFLKKAVNSHADREIHVAPDNLGPAAQPWFWIITRQSIRRGTFSYRHTAH